MHMCIYKQQQAKQRKTTSKLQQKNKPAKTHTKTAATEINQAYTKNKQKKNTLKQICKQQNI